jgi:Spy/CpxP family protein refolding chaperone
MKIRLLRLTLSFLALIFAVCPLHAASSPEHPGSVPVLLGLDSIRKELGLTKSQCQKLDKIRADFKADVRMVTTRTPAGPVEKKAANTTVKTLISRYNEKAVAVLTPAQHARLVQIEFQKLGGLMVFLPGVQKNLGLSADQVAALDRIRSEGETFSSAVTRSFEDGKLTIQERLDALRKYRLKQSSKAVRVLTPGQQKSFQILQGPRRHSA